MAERILHQEWRPSHATTKYPFTERASLTNSDGRVILEGTFLDASFYPQGAEGSLHLSKVVVEFDQATLTISDRRRREVATGIIDLVSPDSIIQFEDTYDRAVGLIVSEPDRLSVFQSWGIGTYLFTQVQAELVPTVCIPNPGLGLSGILLDDGSLMSGDVWLVAEDGVVVSMEETTIAAEPGELPTVYPAIRVDIVGDPLFRRRLCSPDDLFDTPRFWKTLRVIHTEGTFDCTPDELGDIRIAVSNEEASDTSLRLDISEFGLILHVVGSSSR